MYGYLLDQVGNILIVESGDDYGSQQSLLISPDAYREFIFPARKLNQAIRQKAPQAKIYLHCRGAIADIEDLIDCGVDILNPDSDLSLQEWIRLP